MKKLNAFAFYAMVTPVMTLAAVSAMAQQPSAVDIDRAQQSTQRDQGDNPATTQNIQTIPRDSQSNPAISQTGQNGQRATQPSTTQSDQSMPRGSQPTTTNSQGAQGTQPSTQSQSPTGSAHSDSRSQAGMQNRGYMNAAPSSGMHLSDLMGAEVSTARDEDVGSVDELIIDENGQIVAIVVGVGGFLGMAEKEVAIGWGHVTRSGDADNHDLRIDVTGEELRAAPAFDRE